MDKHKIKDLKERLDKESNQEHKNKMLYMWIKQDHISLSEYNTLVKESDSLPCVMPSLEDARIAKEKFQDKKNISGWDTGYKGLGDHFQEGANWALNWISKRNKPN